jgi:erythromycin esterase-like protein
VTGPIIGGVRDIDLSPLDHIAERARVAFLVEMDHFVHEKYDFRLALVRYLAARGWRVFGEEIDERAGERTNSYLRTGDETFLEEIDEPDWYTTGVLTRAERIPELAIEQARFARSVRREVPDARWFGFDIGAHDTDYLELANAAETYGELGPAMALRERRTYERIERRLQTGEKVALMAGSTHLMKRDVEHSASGPGGGTEHSIGHRIAAEHDVLSIWMLNGSGRTSSPWVTDLRPQPGTLNAELAERYDEPALVIPEQDESVRITQMHNLVMTCNLREQVDAIVFVPTVTPLRG